MREAVCSCLLFAKRTYNPDVDFSVLRTLRIDENIRNWLIAFN